MSGQKPSRYALAILNGLQSKPVYAGTVPAEIRDRRRAANRRARLARRGQAQTLAGHTGEQCARRYRHLENVAARATWLSRRGTR